MNSAYPVEDNRRRIAHVEVRQKAKAAGGRNRHVRDAGLGALAEDFWCRSLQGKRIQRTAREIEETVGGRPRGDENASIHNRVEHLDSIALHSNDEWRTSSSFSAGGECWVIAGDNDSNGEDASDVEENQAVNVATGCDWEITTRTLHLATSDHEELWGEGEAINQSVLEVW